MLNKIAFGLALFNLLMIVILRVFCLSSDSDKHSVSTPSPPVERKVDKQKIDKQKTKENNVEPVHYAVLKSGAVWVSYEYLDEFMTTLKNRDRDKLLQMASFGHIFEVKQDTRVICSDSGIYTNVMFVTFQEGVYAGLRGYTFSKFIK